MRIQKFGLFKLILLYNKSYSTFKTLKNVWFMFIFINIKFYTRIFFLK